MSPSVCRKPNSRPTSPWAPGQSSRQLLNDEPVVEVLNQLPVPPVSIQSEHPGNTWPSRLYIERVLRVQRRVEHVGEECALAEKWLDGAFLVRLAFVPVALIQLGSMQGLLSARHGYI